MHNCKLTGQLIIAYSGRFNKIAKQLAGHFLYDLSNGAARSIDGSADEPVSQ